MSLVITPRRSSSASSRQTIAISELFPVPTGPATPRRNERVVSGMEQPHSLDGVLLGELVDQWCAAGGNLLDVGQRRDVGDEPLDVVVHRGEPGDRVGRVYREELE